MWNIHYTSIYEGDLFALKMSVYTYCRISYKNAILAH